MNGSPPPDGPVTQILLVGLGDDAVSDVLLEVAKRRRWRAVRAADHESAVEECKRRWPMVALVDLAALSPDEAESTLRWLRRHGRVSVISLSSVEDVTGRLLALRHGVDDHAIVPLHPDELEARLLALVRRLQRSHVRAFGDLVVDRRARRVLRRGHVVSLTPRELTLLERMMVVAGEVVSKEDLCDALGVPSTSTNLVEVHMSSLRRKLAAEGPPVIHTVHRAGYVFRPTPQIEDRRPIDRRNPPLDAQSPAPPDQDVGNSSGPSSTEPPRS